MQQVQYYSPQEEISRIFYINPQTRRLSLQCYDHKAQMRLWEDENIDKFSAYVVSKAYENKVDSGAYLRQVA